MRQSSLVEKVLKWVEREYGAMTADNVARDIIEKTVKEFRKQVDQLLKEIEKFEELARKAGKDPLTKLSEDFIAGILEGYKDCKNLIKKAFSGVLRE